MFKLLYLLVSFFINKSKYFSAIFDVLQTFSPLANTIRVFAPETVL